jgi:ketosteroid isomerase-like protein
MCVLCVLCVLCHALLPRRLYDAINRRDVSQLSACFAADVQYQNLALMETFTGATVSDDTLRLCELLWL